MNTKVLEYILAISEEGSISKAADRFYLAQPALSAHLKNLEKEYGAPLFYRSKGKMVLTKAGILFANNARLILHHERELYAEIERIKSENTNSIRFLTERSYRNYIIRYVLPEFQKIHPDVNLSIDTANTIQALKAIRSNQADLALCVMEETAVSGLKCEIAGYGNLVLGISSEYKGPADFSAITSEINNGLMPVLHPVGSSTRILEERALVRANVFPKEILEVQTFHNALDYVKNTRSFAFFPQHFHMLDDSGIITTPPVIDFNSVLVHQDNEELSDEVFDFKQILLTALSGFNTRKSL